ncbi:Double-strand break repair protein mus-23 [Cytospora mali]|uniref:Double-strand break repair protein n=1 Tax=Cytospora mali TaxID=578113 RepID=A0A194VT07_CYTMA|nr:Double-strand break repair protein mus-23 [Valsa mali]
MSVLESLANLDICPGDDTIRILVATDNHVGYEERDPIRKDDSWKTFDEIMNLARTQDVDMVLLGGDLFHDNKPSRKSMYQVMRSLRKNCMGMKPCELEFLSDANEVFEGAFPHVNYEDPDINISIPVFSIHGNHDDPSGDGHFCTLDLLQVAGLVNYFGRVPEMDNIQVKPVLLQKGRTKLALFGLSNVRDERIFRTFRDHHVTFFRPTAQAGDFFNLMTVHQNHHAHTATGYLPEGVLPDWMDLIVWGHEHECRIDPVQNPQTGFHVLQPGSSVATSLIPAESVKKQVAILSITGKEFKCDPIPLKTVRPLVTKDIVLQQLPQFKQLQDTIDNRENVTKELVKIVEEMIDEANDEWLQVQDIPEDQIDEEDRPLPLIRLKVEYTAAEGGNFDVENPQRFSNRFVGKVANVNDVVSFYRKKASSKRTNQDDTELPERLLEAMGHGVQGDDVIKVEVLVKEFLEQSSLQVLPKNQFVDTLVQFVEKGGSGTMDEFVNEALTKSLKAILKLDEEADFDVDQAVETWREAAEQRWAKNSGSAVAAKRRLKPRPEDYDSDLEGHWGNNDSHWETVTSVQAGKSNGRGRQNASDEDVEMGNGLFVSQQVEDSVMAEPPKGKRGAAAKKAPAKKAPAAKTAPATRARPKKKSGFVVDSDEEEQEEAQEDAMSEDVFMDEEEDDPPAPPPKRAARNTKPAATRTAAPRATKAAAATKAKQAKQTTLNFSQSQRPAGTQRVAQTQKTLEISDDEIEEDDDDAFEPIAPPTRSRRR